MKKEETLATRRRREQQSTAASKPGTNYQNIRISPLQKHSSNPYQMHQICSFSTDGPARRSRCEERVWPTSAAAPHAAPPELQPQRPHTATTAHAIPSDDPETMNRAFACTQPPPPKPRSPKKCTLTQRHRERERKPRYETEY